MAKKTGRGASAAEGALAGATLGSTLGVPGAIAGGLIGAAGGAMFGGDEYAAMTEEELAALKRRQELGTLGLTDEEMAVMAAESQGRTAQQFEQAADQRAALTATTGLGAGRVQKEALEEQANLARLQQEDADRIRLADMQEKLREESRIQELTGEMSKKTQEQQDRVLASAFGMADLATGMGLGADQDALAMEKLQAQVDMAERLKKLGINMEGMSYEDLSSMGTGAAS
jgi:hypothetical protein